MFSSSILSLLVFVLSTTSFVSAGHARIQALHRGHHGAKRHAPEKLRPPEKRQGNGSRFTYYQTGLGACGGYNNPNDLIVALNEYQWDNGAHCNQQITININGHTETATVTDLCPFDSCPPGALDFSRGLFSKWSDNPERDGVLFGQWWFGNGQPQQPPPPPPTPHPEPTTTTTEAPPPPTTTTSTTPSPPPPTTTSSAPTSSSTSSTPTSTSAESSPTSTSESAPTSSSAPAPAPTGVVSDAQQVLAGFGVLLSAALSIPK